MSNDQFDCPKCFRNFHSKTKFRHHLELCAVEKDPLALDSTEEDEGKKGGESTEDTSGVVIEIEDDDEPLQTRKVWNPKYSIHLVNSAPSFPVKVSRLACYYCGQVQTERISLAKHLVGQHWGQVRDRQGGGRRDNYSYYANIEDSRVIKSRPATVKQVFRNNYGQNKLTRNNTNDSKPPNRRILPNLNGPIRPPLKPSSFSRAGSRLILPSAGLRPPPWTAAIRKEDFDKVNRGATSTIVNTNHSSLRKVGPNLELDKVVKKFAHSNPNLKITKVSKKTLT